MQHSPHFYSHSFPPQAELGQDDPTSSLSRILTYNKIKTHKMWQPEEEGMSVIWSVDKKENSQRLFNIPVWSVCTSRKPQKKKEKREKRNYPWWKTDKMWQLCLSVLVVSLKSRWSSQIIVRRLSLKACLNLWCVEALLQMTMFTVKISFQYKQP